MQPSPFKRAIAMAAAISAALSNAPASMHHMLLSAMEPYKSRGHGKGKLGKALPRQTSWKALLKGQTCGKRECARRVKQMASV